MHINRGVRGCSREGRRIMIDMWEEDPLPVPSTPIVDAPNRAHSETLKRKPAIGRRSNASRGAYYKGRTRKWLEDLGYQVADLEVVRWVTSPGGTIRFPVKRDQFGSDLLAMNKVESVYVQVKSGKVSGNFPAARRKFDEFQWPPNTRRWVVAWAPRSRQPRVIEM